MSSASESAGCKTIAWRDNGGENQKGTAFVHTEAAALLYQESITQMFYSDAAL